MRRSTLVTVTVAALALATLVFTAVPSHRAAGQPPPDSSGLWRVILSGDVVTNLLLNQGGSGVHKLANLDLAAMDLDPAAAPTVEVYGDLFTELGQETGAFDGVNTEASVDGLGRTGRN